MRHSYVLPRPRRVHNLLQDDRHRAALRSPFSRHHGGLLDLARPRHLGSQQLCRSLHSCHCCCPRFCLDKLGWDRTLPATISSSQFPSHFLFSAQASTWLFPATESPHYRTASRVLISFTVIIIVFCTLNLLYLKRENAKKAVKRDEDEREGREIDPEEWQRLGDKHPHYVYAY
jgi:hypothetical protein